MKLIGLTPDTEYRAQVKSADPDGNAAFSALATAERSGQGSGRIYTIDGSCGDASGNVTTRSTTVSVPLNMSKK